MHSTLNSDRGASPLPESGLWGWLNRRTGLDDLLRTALDEPIPGGARLAYILGSGLLFIFISQVITGIFLALYYVPSADHAHTTVAYITKAVTAGSFLRSLHAYGASAMVVVLFLHLSQTYIYGSYKGRRELLWLSGCVLFGLVLAMAFTGYLLPWDQRAYFATAVGTNAVSEAPWIGESIKRLIRGGTEMGTLTISRFFVAHVFLIPACIFAFVAAHIFLFRKAGAAGPVNEDPYHPKQKAESFYPRQVLMDLSLTALLIIGLGLLCFLVPIQLGPPANPADAQYIPRPEWYYLPIFEILAWLGRDRWRACNSGAPCPGRPCASISGSRHRAAPMEAACGNGSVHIRGVLANRPRFAQPVLGSARFWSRSAIGEAKGRRRRIRAQTVRA
jgi:ubiquinol-cytochrome c reductase cytochrome b subunit